jgi:exosortase A
MSAAAGGRARPVLRAVTPILPALAVALAVLAALFVPDMAAAVRVWNSSTAYGHCWLVLPIVGWLIYERRGQAAAERATPILWPVLLAVPLLGLWLGADILGIMEGRQIALIGFVEVAALAVLGPRLWWVLSPALLYLIFLVPFGAFLTGPLQDFTAGFVAYGLDLLGVPNRVTQFQIEIPEGSFYVAEACAGLRFLIASIAFGTLYAVTMFQGAWRRVVFIAVSCIVPVVANGFRGLGIVMLGHFLGSAQAAATDHVLYGWIFFSIVIVALALAGMPFRQDPAPCRAAPALPTPGVARRAFVAVLPVLAVAALGPAADAALSAGPGAPGLARPVLIAGPACLLTGSTPAGAVLWQTFQCGSSVLTARTEMLPARANPSQVTRAGLAWAASQVPGLNTDNRLLRVAGGTVSAWRLIVDENGPRAAATLLFVDAAPSLGGIRDRLRLAADMLGGGAVPPVAIAVAVTGGDADGTEALRLFLGAQGDLQGRVKTGRQSSR